MIYHTAWRFHIQKLSKGLHWGDTNFDRRYKLFGWKRVWKKYMESIFQFWKKKTLTTIHSWHNPQLCNNNYNKVTIYNKHYSIHVPGWLQKWLNLITAPGSVSNEPGSVTWLATKYLKTVSWKNYTEKLTTLWPQNISFWPKINIPSSYFTILMLNCLENTLKPHFDS